MSIPLSRKKSLVDDFMDRSIEGALALRSAAWRPHPGRIAYLVAGAAAVGATATRSDRVTRVVKPALMPMLATDILFPDATLSNPASWRKLFNPSGDQAVLLAGLVGGWLGDMTLMNTESRSEDPQVRAKNLNRGAAWFSLNQLAYIWLLAKRGARPDPAVVAAHVPVLAAGLGLAGWKLPPALPAAGGYGALLGGTNVLAQDRGIIRDEVDKTPADYGISHGGNLFIMSDALILNRMTLFKNAQKEGASAVLKTIDAINDGAVMATYVIAQLLLFNGLNDGAAKGTPVKPGVLSRVRRKIGWKRK